MKKTTWIVCLFVLLLTGFASVTGAAWPHWGRHNRSGSQLSKEHHSVQPKTAHPKAPKKHSHVPQHA